MKIFYLPKTPFGEFFYDLNSHEGVAISEGRPINLGMSADYNPREDPSCVEVDVDEGVFSKLKDASLRHSSAIRDLEYALRHFPRATADEKQLILL